MNEGREQIYGTQMGGIRDGRVVPWPIEAPDTVDDRRAAMSLDPLATYAASFPSFSDDASTGLEANQKSPAAATAPPSSRGGGQPD